MLQFVADGALSAVTVGSYMFKNPSPKFAFDRTNANIVAMIGLERTPALANVLGGASAMTKVLFAVSGFVVETD